MSLDAKPEPFLPGALEEVAVVFRRDPVRPDIFVMEVQVKRVGDGRFKAYAQERATEQAFEVHGFAPILDQLARAACDTLRDLCNIRSFWRRR